MGGRAGKGNRPLNPTLFWLQHIALLLWLLETRFFEIVRYRTLTQPSGGAFQQDGRSGRRKPEHHPVRPALHQPHERHRRPQAEAIKAIEQLAEEAISSKRSQFHERVP